MNLVGLLPNAPFQRVLHLEVDSESRGFGHDLNDGTLNPLCSLFVLILHLCLDDRTLHGDARGIFCLCNELLYLFQAPLLDARGTHECKAGRIVTVIRLCENTPSCSNHARLLSSQVCYFTHIVHTVKQLIDTIKEACPAFNSGLHARALKVLEVQQPHWPHKNSSRSWRFCH